MWDFYNYATGTPRAAIISAIVLVLVIVLIYIMTVGRPDIHEYMTGFWKADKNFCEYAEIDDMFIYIGPVSRGYLSSTADGYIIIDPDIANQKFSIKFSPRAGDTIWAEFVMEDQLLPRKVSINIDIYSGMMKIYSGDELYAVMYKNHEISNYV